MATTTQPLITVSTHVNGWTPYYYNCETCGGALAPEERHGKTCAACTYVAKAKRILRFRIIEAKERFRSDRERERKQRKRQG